MLKQINRDAVWKEIHTATLGEADRIITLPVSERIKTGMRLLAVSRENLRRIFILSYAYRMTGQEKYLVRAEQEMLKAASFSDWNPSHFLDVGEMTMALGVGYDWLYPALSEASRRTIREAIVEKGFKPSYDTAYNWFVDAEHNWNQVCNGGLAFGAIAVAESEPEWAQKIIDRAIDKVRLPMRHYAPDGAYPEGARLLGLRHSVQCIADRRPRKHIRHRLRFKPDAGVHADRNLRNANGQPAHQTFQLHG